jgi:hypothetical protein
LPCMGVTIVTVALEYLWYTSLFDKRQVSCYVFPCSGRRVVGGYHRGLLDVGGTV